jgi:hypothetical protein
MPGEIVYQPLNNEERHNCAPPLGDEFSIDTIWQCKVCGKYKTFKKSRYNGYTRPQWVGMTKFEAKDTLKKAKRWRKRTNKLIRRERALEAKGQKTGEIVG